MRLSPLFVILPLVEIALFVLVGSAIGVWGTLGLVLASSLLGLSLIRRQSLSAMREMQKAEQGQMQNPLSPVAHGVLRFFAAAMLLLPGFFTSALGLLLLVPQLRELVISKLGAKFKMVMPQAAGFGPRGPNPQQARDDITVIDAEYFEIDENNPPRGPSGWTRH